MDRDIYNVILSKIAEVGELINSIGGDTSDLETEVETLSGAVETLQSHDTITANTTNSFSGFTDSSTGILIKINPTTNRLVVSDGTSEYYYTLTPYTT